MNTETQTIHNKTFLEALQYCKRAMSTDETRYFMTGVNIEEEKDNYLFVSTDGRRLHLVRLKKAILPDLQPGNYTLSSINGTVAVLEPLEGTFPNWRRVLPDYSEYTSLEDAPSHINYEPLKDCGSFSSFFCRLIKKFGCILNFNYMYDALVPVKKGWDSNEVLIGVDEKDPALKAFHFKLQGRLDAEAVIMPMQV